MQKGEARGLLAALELVRDQRLHNVKFGTEPKLLVDDAFTAIGLTFDLLEYY
jgi:hypothetical protein